MTRRSRLVAGYAVTLALGLPLTYLTAVTSLIDAVWVVLGMALGGMVVECWADDAATEAGIERRKVDHA